MATREQAQYEERWTEFQQLSQMQDHWWWRPGWHVGRRCFTWHLTFEDSHELHSLVTRIQNDLDLPGLDLVPQEGLHLTMQGIGFTDEVDADDVAAIVAQARIRLAERPRFDLTLGPVDADAEGIGLLVQPWGDVEETRLRVRQSIAAVWGEENVPEQASGFRPHVTVAYSAGDADLDEVRARLKALRGIEPARVNVSQVQLIRLDRDEKVYRWDVVASATLRGGGTRSGRRGRGRSCGAALRRRG